MAAKDIIDKGGIVVKAGSEQSLKEAVEFFMDKKNILEYKNSINEMQPVKNWSMFVKENYDLYGVKSWVLNVYCWK